MVFTMISVLLLILLFIGCLFAQYKKRRETWNIVVSEIREGPTLPGASLAEETTEPSQEETAQEEAQEEAGKEKVLLPDEHEKSTPVIPESFGDASVDKRVRGTISPFRRGGRSRVQFPEERREKRKAKRRSDLKPSISSLRMDIICWDEPEWVIGAEFYSRIRNMQVFQGESRLDPCNYNRTRFRLKNQENIKIILGEEECVFPLPLGEEGYYIFKMKKDWTSPGRLVSTLNKGNYIIMTPNDWIRDETLNPAPFGEEYVSGWGLTAHFFHIDQDSKVRFITAEGKKIEIDIKSKDYLELEGEHLIDESKMGPLFIRNIPILKVNSIDYWDSVSTIVIGREGRGTNRWRMEFAPARTSEQELPEALEERGGGWYYIRVYDQNKKLKESLDFRYSKGLHKVVIPSFHFPSEDGYQPVEIEFHCATDCDVLLQNHSNLIKDKRSEAIIYQIPPLPIYDQTDWVIVDRRAKTPLRITLDRIWWMAGLKTEDQDESVNDSNWQAQPLVFAPEDFYATSNKVLWVKITKPLASRRVELGFSDTPYRSYPMPQDNVIKVPLSDFTDSMDWVNFSGSVDFKLWVKEKGDQGIKLAKVCYEFYCQYCGENFSDSEDLFSHISQKHLNECFSLLQYEEMQKYLPELPKFIYRCNYCGYYAESSNLDSPTSKITDHVEKCMKKYVDEFSADLKFRIITDLNEIRENVIRNLPEMYKCRLCPFLNEEVVREGKIGGKTARLRHLQKHKNEIVQSCRKRW